MPTYLYQAEDGELHEEVRPMSKRHKLGEKITRDGKTFARIFEASVGQGPNITKPFAPYKTRVIPKHTPGFKHDTDGRCIVETREQERAYAKQTGMEWE